VEEKVFFKPNPRVAAILSFVFTGLGQIYNGQIKKGLTLMFLAGVSLIIFLVGAIFIGHAIITFFGSLPLLVWGIVLFLIGFIGIIILGIYNISDAYQTAEKICQQKETEVGHG